MLKDGVNDKNPETFIGGDGCVSDVFLTCFELICS